MFGSTILDVAIGLVFVFLLASLIGSAVREGIESYLKTRAAYLEAGLRELLKDSLGTALVKDFYDHPIIYSLYAGEYAPPPQLTGSAAARAKTYLGWRGRNLPSYIPSSSFALALMDMAARGPQLDRGTSPGTTAPVTVDAIRGNLGTIENPSVQRALLVALDRAEGDLDQVQASLESWYNSAMDRVSGWYKRQTQWILLGIGLLLAAGLNINALHIGFSLYHDNTARQLLVQAASSTAASAQTTPLTYSDAMSKLTGGTVPIGWPDSRQEIGEELKAHWPSDLAGWIITAFAISMGAPFWFDILNKLIVVRSTVKPHQKSLDEPSQDGAPASADPGALPPPVAAAPAQAPAQVPAQLPAAGGMAAATASPPTVAPPPDEDGCDVDMTKDITADEELPVAAGGVS